jgi:hypothetical protein
LVLSPLLILSFLERYKERGEEWGDGEELKLRMGGRRVE